MTAPLLFLELDKELLEEGAVVPKVQPADCRSAILLRAFEGVR